MEKCIRGSCLSGHSDRARVNEEAERRSNRPLFPLLPKIGNFIKRGWLLEGCIINEFVRKKNRQIADIFRLSPRYREFS